MADIQGLLEGIGKKIVGVGPEDVLVQKADEKAEADYIKKLKKDLIEWAEYYRRILEAPVEETLEAVEPVKVPEAPEPELKDVFE